MLISRLVRPSCWSWWRALWGLPPTAFINCSFDAKYRDIFDALVFAVSYCGIWPVVALSRTGHGKPRMLFLHDMFLRCTLLLHEVTETPSATDGCRHNTISELSYAMGLGRGADCLIFASSASVFYKTTSDWRLLDIEEHGNDPELLVRKAVSAIAVNMPGHQNTLLDVSQAVEMYRYFRQTFAELCERIGVGSDDNLALRACLIFKVVQELITKN